MAIALDKQLALPLQPTDPDEAARPHAAGASARHAIVDGQAMPYRLRRARRRTIGLTIDDDGLTISAPRWVSLREIDATIVERKRWIRRALEQWQVHRDRREALRIRWQHGGTIDLLGSRRRIELTGGAGPVRDTGSALQVGLAGESGSAAVRKRLEAWLKEHARTVFGERCALLAARSGLVPRRWQLSSARTRWGSCAVDGTIRLNWRLVHFSLDVVDYVIAHEFAHLRQMNHGPEFWLIVERLCPDWQTARARLNEYPSDL